MQISARIKAVRGDLSQTEFGERIGVTKFAISNYETGRQGVPERTINDICREFGINTLWLRTGAGDMRSSTNDELITLVDHLLMGKNETAKTLFRALAELPPEDWVVIERLIESVKRG